MARTPNRSEHSERDEPTSVDERSTRTPEGSVTSVESNKAEPSPDIQLSFVSAERIIQTPPVKQRKRLRLAFTPTEDELLYNYVLRKYEENYSIKGMVIYKALALEHPRHTAHAWRDRAINRIAPLLVTESPRERDRTRKASRSKFTAEDDQFLCDWVIEKQQERESISGNAIYRDLAHEHSHHTFHSWRDRVLRVIIPQLKKNGQWPEENTVTVENEMTMRQRRYEENRENDSCNNDSGSSDDIAERVKRRRGKMKEVENHNRDRHKAESETEEECEHEACAQKRVKSSTSRRVTAKISN